MSLSQRSVCDCNKTILHCIISINQTKHIGRAPYVANESEAAFRYCFIITTDKRTSLIDTLTVRQCRWLTCMPARERCGRQWRESVSACSVCVLSWSASRQTGSPGTPSCASISNLPTSSLNVVSTDDELRGASHAASALHCTYCQLRPAMWVRGCRIGPLRFLVGWRKRRLNQAFSFVLV